MGAETKFNDFLKNYYHEAEITPDCAVIPSSKELNTAATEISTANANSTVSMTKAYLTVLIVSAFVTYLISAEPFNVFITLASIQGSFFVLFVWGLLSLSVKKK